MIVFNKNHIPYLTVVIDPGGSDPVVMTLSDDWLYTGEYVLSVTPLEALVFANQAMQQASDWMAEELWEKMKERERMELHSGDESSMDA